MTTIDLRAERLDIEACEENLGIYAKAGDARSCRDIGRALARELTATRELADTLESLAERVISLGRDLPPSELATMRDIRLAEVIALARKALDKGGA